MGVVRPLRAGVATLATAGLAIGGSQFFAPPSPSHQQFSKGPSVRSHRR